MENGLSFDAYSQQQPHRNQESDGEKTESEHSEQDNEINFENQKFKSDVRAGSSLNLFRQYLQWYTKHVVG